MKMIFLGTLFNINDELELLRKSTSGLQNQANSFQWALINGFDTVLKKPIDILNVLPVGTYPKYYSDFLLKSCLWSHSHGAEDKELGSVNIPVLKQVTRSFFLNRELKKWIERNSCEKDLHIVVYSSYLPFLSAVKNLSSTVKITLIVTDIPEYDDLTRSQNVLKRKMREINNRLIHKFLQRIDYFVILTEQMKKPLDINRRPYIVIEGVIDEKAYSNQEEMFENHNKIVLYTGSLTYKLGIMNLIDSFSLIENDNYELWICGTGECEIEIKERVNQDDRIIYYGYVEKQRVYELQQKASVLVNTRTNEDEYTKFSFPSKTMEYMASGKPVIMYKLYGIPCEYDEFLYYFSENSPKHIAEKILEICEKSELERKVFGEKARAFVLEKKNSIVQAEKIINMIKTDLNAKNGDSV